MHPHLRLAIAQAHTDELRRVATQRRVVDRRDARVSRPKVARPRVTLRPANAIGAHR
jgi:hypothetical protein